MIASYKSNAVCRPRWLYENNIAKLEKIYCVLLKHILRALSIQKQTEALRITMMTAVTGEISEMQMETDYWVIYLLPIRWSLVQRCEWPNRPKDIFHIQKSAQLAF